MAVAVHKVSDSDIFADNSGIRFVWDERNGRQEGEVREIPDIRVHCCDDPVRWAVPAQLEKERGLPLSQVG